MRTACLILAAAALTAPRLPAAAQPVIDDFETGSIHLASTGGFPTPGSVAVSSPGHAISAYRNVVVQSPLGGLPTHADLDAGTAVDDALRITISPSGGLASVWYQPSTPVDLTDGGLNDRIEVSFLAVTTGAMLTVRAEDGSAVAWHDMPLSGGANVVHIADLTGIDPTKVLLFQVIVEHPGGGMFDLRDIRAMRDGSIWQKFDIVERIVAGPPYPMPELAYLVTDAMPSDTQAATLVGAVKAASGTAAEIALAATDSGGDLAAGYAGAVTASWNEGGVPYGKTSFDLRVDLDALAGVDPVPFLPALPAVVITPTGFLLPYDVEFLGTDGMVVRTSRRQLHVDALTGQALAFSEVRVHASGAATAVGAAGFRVTFEAADAGGVDPGEPLFEVTFTGDCRPAAATGVPGTANALAPGAGLVTACPTVTRGGTELRLSRPADSEGRIDLFDVTGRVVRTLRYRPGDVVRTWDGRGADGRPTAAGVYFAHLAGAPRGSGARVVRVP